MSEELFENTQSEEAAQNANNPYAQSAPPAGNPQGMSNTYTQMPEDNRNPYMQQGYAPNPQNPYVQQGYAPNPQNPYMQQGYVTNAQNPYIQQPKPKGDGVGFGIASLALGITSVFLFGCCVNYITAILAIVFAVVQMVKNRQKGMAIAGIVTACVSILLGTLMWIGVAINMDDTNVDNLYDNFYDYYENEYPLYNSIDEL